MFPDDRFLNWLDDMATEKWGNPSQKDSSQKLLRFKLSANEAPFKKQLEKPTVEVHCLEEESSPPSPPPPVPQKKRATSAAEAINMLENTVRTVVREELQSVWREEYIAANVEEWKREAQSDLKRLKTELNALLKN